MEHVISENQGFDYEVRETEKSTLCLGFHPTGTTLNMYNKHKRENHGVQLEYFLGPTYDEVLWTTLKKILIILRIHSICEDYSCVFRQTATIARTSELVISESDLVTGNWSLFLVHKHSVVIGIRTEKIVLKDACGDLYKMKWLAVDR